MLTLSMSVRLDVSTRQKADRVLRRIELRLGHTIHNISVTIDQHHPELGKFQADFIIDAPPTGTWADAVYQALRIVHRLGDFWLVTEPQDEGRFNWWGQRGQDATPT